MLESFKYLNTISPLAIIALLSWVIYLLVNAKKVTSRIATNHLHGLPTMEVRLEQILETLQRMEVAQESHFAYLRARLNGKL